jgi:hypothetical protein
MRLEKRRGGVFLFETVARCVPFRLLLGNRAREEQRQRCCQDDDVTLYG